MMMLLVILLTIKCVMVSTNTPSNHPTTINTPHYDTPSTTNNIRRTQKRALVPHTEELPDYQFKDDVITKLDKITENVRENKEAQHQRQETIQQIEQKIQQIEETIRRLEEDFRLREETTTTQLRKIEESLARCDEKLQQPTPHNNNTRKNNTRSPARDCSDIERKSETKSGVYQIFPHSSAGVSVWCEIEDEHMWTVFLVRQNQTPQENFSRTWRHYKTGFGDPLGEYWLGNANLHALTSRGHYRLKVIATNLRGEQHSGVWETFSVADEAHKYRVTVGGYTNTSTLGDPLTKNMNGRSFTTKDYDNDESDGNCAVHHGGGWWHNNCGWVTATSPLSNIDDQKRALYWRHFNPRESHRTGLSKLLMMITTTDTTTTDTTTTQH